METSTNNISILSLIEKELEHLQTHFPLIIKKYKGLVSLDIETSPKEEYKHLEDAALNYFTGKIDLIGFVGVNNDGVLFARQFDMLRSKPCDVRAFLLDLKSKGIKLTGHNTKFDLKYIIHNNILTYDEACELWSDDSSIGAAITIKKIPKIWLENYEKTRMDLNKTRKHGHGHRKASGGSLKTLAPFHLGIDAFWETEEHNNPKYNLLDCLYTYYLTAIMKEQVNELDANRCYNDLMDRVKLLMRAELDGIKLDRMATLERMRLNEEKLTELEQQIHKQWAVHFDNWRALQQKLLEEKYANMTENALTKNKKGASYKELWDNKYKKLYEKALEKLDFDLNLNSPAQLAWLLRDQLGYDITDLKDEDEESTGKAVLEYLSSKYPDVGVLIEYRKASKLQSSFYPKLLEFSSYDDFIHCQFNITGAKTGRLSSSKPNTQQIPKKLKSLFTADEGNVLVDLDMSALEPVLIAYYTEDEVLIDLITSGKSFHSFNAMVMFPYIDCDISEVGDKFPLERKAAKLAGLSILYGSGAKQLQFSLTGLGFKFTIEECKKIVYKIRDAYPKVWAFKKELDKELEQGATVYNYLGRPLHFDNPEDIYLKGFNSLIQGSGSDIVVQSAVDLCKEYSWIQPKILVHDSICIEVKQDRAEEALKLLNQHMTKWNIGDKLKFSTEGGFNKTWDI